MKSLTALIVPFIFITALLANIISEGNYHNLQEISKINSIVLDSLEDNSSNSGPLDASGMFNERGFYGSNSASINENEIISNFNGNLQYSIPLFDIKGAGDLNINMTLNYNGSVGHKIVCGRANSQVTGDLKMYNISVPSWIVGVNGYAVQMTNYETNFFTSSPTSTTISNDNVRLLANGYHITDEFRAYSDGLEVRVFVMRADGSVLTLKRVDSENPSNCSQSLYAEDCYIGEFYSEDKQNYTRAFLEFMENDNYINPAYRNRRMYLMDGSGVTYIFEEEKPVYLDYPVNSNNPATKPQNFLLKKIKDRYGREITLQYNAGVYGRAIFTNLTTNYDETNIGTFYGASYLPSFANGFRISGNEKTYRFLFDQTTYLKTDGFHRPVITEIKNPVNDVIAIDYGLSYQRIATNIYNPYNLSAYNVTCSLNVLKRMSSFQNYNGGIYTYSYPSGTNSLSINMKPGDNYKIKSNSSAYYKGVGRDMFFVNMLSSVTYNPTGTNYTKTSNFNYNFVCNRGENCNIILVDTNDEYSTTRSNIANNKPSWDSTPSTFNTLYKYRQFPISASANIELPPDFEGYTKLTEERNFLTNYENPFRKIEYTFIKAQSNGIYKNSSFLDTGITETFDLTGSDPISKHNSFIYEFESTPITDLHSNNPIKKKIEKDNFYNSTEIFYKNLYTEVYYYKDAVYYPSFPTRYDTSKFYVLNLPDTILRKNSTGTVLSRMQYEYASGNFNSNGYIAQLLKEKVFSVGTNQGIKEKKYYYNKQDTVGIWLFGQEGYKPATEGSIRMTEDPLGNKTNFYYHNIYKSQNNVEGDFNYDIQTDEMENPGVVSYRKVLTNNTILRDSTGKWSDLRMPVRTDNYIKSDYKITSYSNYTMDGIPDEQISYNNYYNYFRYDAINRIREGVLPYDFTIENEQEVIDTVYETVNYELFPSAVGGYSYVKTNSAYYPLDTNCNVGQGWSGQFQLFRYEFETPGGDPEAPIYENNIPLIKFNIPDVDSLVDITSAQFVISPMRFKRETNNDTSISLVDVKFKTLLNFSGAGINNFEIGSNYQLGYLNAPNEYTSSGYFENIIDLTQLIRNEIIVEDNPFQGLTFDVEPNGDYIEIPSQHYIIDLQNNESAQTWCERRNMKLIVSGLKRSIRRYYIYEYSYPTIKNTYDDTNNIVTSQTKIAQTDMYKKTQNIFDGFYRLSKSRLWTSSTEYDSSQIKYNYLDMKSETIDGKNNSTKFSYSELLTLDRTINADNSMKLDSTYFQENLSYTFGTVSGLINVNLFTDETGRKYIKYLDAVGNLRREVRFAEVGNPGSSNVEELITDYKLDDLYRVIEVRTPEDKRIYYTYDGFGRQSSRTAPDNGEVKFIYDKNDNVIYSQDKNQAQTGLNVWTYRTFDGLNRMLILGTSPQSGPQPDFSNLTDEQVQTDGPYFYDSTNLLTVNVYDTIANKTVDIFDNIPSDYYTGVWSNNTRGNIVVTAYRTVASENWGFKWYRYDARGRVIKMWHQIDGMGTKVTEYDYNSSNQMIYTNYQPGGGDYNLTRNMLDDAGR
ncbi:MAG TPA: hypothetical protein DEP28_10310, partial [Bacteroidetes bacterium]|nr:hypothetical protein [Bacteroidota bacterium]